MKIVISFMDPPQGSFYLWQISFFISFSAGMFVFTNQTKNHEYDLLIRFLEFLKQWGFYV